ncbi:hypothetical protein MesoLjLc_65100 [Mesorhizobium sp. L-8-10]|nr:hypothetical protein MesoLjLc_65100 [Mesorhizobium sp. L-8-10]
MAAAPAARTDFNMDWTSSKRAPEEGNPLVRADGGGRWQLKRESECLKSQTRRKAFGVVTAGFSNLVKAA